MNISSRIQWQQFGPHRVLFSDFTGVPADEWVALIEAEHELIMTQAPHSVLLLSDFSGARFTPAVARVLDHNAHLHSDRIRASAVVGPTASMRLAMANTAREAKRALRAVASRDEGLRYLAGVADEAAA